MPTSSRTVSPKSLKSLRIALFLALSVSASFTSSYLTGCSYSDTSNAATDAPSASASTNAEGNAEGSSEQNKDLSFESIPVEQIMSIENLHDALDADNGSYVLDVRSRSNHEDEHIDGSHNIPAGRQIDIRMNEIPRDKIVIIISKGTDRLAEVRQTLVDAGYDPSSLFVVPNAMEDWIAAGYPTVEGKGYHC